MSFLKENKYWVLAGGLTLYFAISGIFFYQHYYDFDHWAYSASLREMSRHLLYPNDPHLLLSIPSSWFSPYLFLWVIFKKVTGFSVFTVLGVAGTVNFLVLVCGLYAFVRSYFSNPKLPSLVLITMLFFWGKGWDYSGCLDFDFLRLGLCYPYALCLGLSLVCFYLVLNFFGHRRPIDLIIIVIIISFILLTHRITASFCFLGIVVLALFERGVGLKVRALILATIPAAMLLGLGWPFYSYFEEFQIYGVVGKVDTPELRLELIPRLGPMLLGLPAAIYYFIRGRRLSLGILFLACSVIYLVSYFVRDAVFSRYIFFVAFFLSIFISIVVWEMYLSFKEHPTGISRVVLYAYTTILIGGLMYQGAKIILKYEGYRSLDEVLHKRPSAVGYVGQTFLKKFTFLKHFVKDDDVIISDPITAWTIPSFSGKTVSVAIGHSSIFVQDSHQRYYDTEKFFNDETNDDFRRGIFKKYQVDYLLINLKFVSPELASKLEKLGQVVYRDEIFTLVDVRN